MQDISIPEINAMDPGTLNSFFSGKQVYDREGNIQWEPPFFRPECIPGKDKRYFRNEENRSDGPFIGRDLSHCACPCERTGKFSLCPSGQMPGRTVLVHGSPPCRRGACPAVGLREPYLCHPLSVPPLTYSEPYKTAIRLPGVMAPCRMAFLFFVFIPLRSVLPAFALPSEYPSSALPRRFPFQW